MLSQEFLRQTVLFNELTEDELLEVVMIGCVKNYNADTVIFKEGDPGDTIYLVVSGSVRISKMHNGTEEALAVLESRSFFGEMALFDRQDRSAYAIAHVQTSLFAITMQDLVALFDRNQAIAYKFLWAFCRTLTDRLRTTNEKFQVIMSLANSGF
ncbi:cyclic nucleotide-binding domain-containing protein [Acanthopleuribacter pedis]|uniref:Cyclic nucleotide-binding domain-containing protein n=1 Tax=Acanthopleuribacter pedis TaxID=442870 RepID=A0A8J7QGP1_9BACT|nr:cyclic nucleotide-binding domain-containing protein [Acanthopleuribacter pedis]MBO1320021.1 cyclic nucleotide-binding domain-containing protein [Acanthopleuribacter pedis]